MCFILNIAHSKHFVTGNFKDVFIAAVAPAHLDILFSYSLTGALNARFNVKLSQRIEVRSNTGYAAGQAHRDSEFFHKTFPFFIWLLRDVAQEIPRDCRNIEDYFLKKV